MAALLLVGCAEPLDTTRVSVAQATVGADIYQVMCERMASEADPTDVSGERTRDLCRGRASPDTTPDTAPFRRLRALAENRDRLIGVLDEIFPAPMADDLHLFFRQMLPLYDPPERLPRQTRAVAHVLGEVIADDAALTALARVGLRRGYRPPRFALGAARPLLGYPGLDPLARQTLATIEPGGVAETEWRELLQVLALELATAEPTAAAPPPVGSTLGATRGLLLQTDPAYGPSTGPGPARFATVRDRRGIAMPDDAAGLPVPFADLDGDGLADVDADGHFLNALGAVVFPPTPFPVVGDAPAFRDVDGRALGVGGTPLYKTVDVSQSLLAGVLREAPALFAPDAQAGLEFTRGLYLLYGPPNGRARLYGRMTHNYDGFNTTQGALFDLVHGLGAALDKPEVFDALEVLRILLRDYESETAALIDTGLFVSAQAAMRSASLEQPSNFWDDLLQVTAWLAQEPGMLEGLLRALADNRTLRLGQILSEMMRYRDRVSFVPGDINAVRSAVVFRDRVDRATPDTLNNESIFQRTTALIHDLDGAQLCNRPGAFLTSTLLPGFRWPTVGSYAECDLFQIDNITELFSQSVLGRAEIVIKDAALMALGRATVDQMLEDESGIIGMTTRPTPEALARFTFAPHNVFLQNLLDPVRTRDGVDLRARHGGTYFTWERDYRFADGRTPARIDFLGAMTPLLTAFDDFDRRTVGRGIAPGSTGPRFLFGQFMSALHLHWPSRQAQSTQSANPGVPSYAFQDNIRSYESNLIDAFDAGEMFIRLHALVRALDRFEIRPGVDGITVLAAATEALVDPARNPGVTDRAGSTSTQVNDGTRTVTVTPLYLILDGLKHMDQAFATDSTRHASWLSARSTLVDHFLTPESFGPNYRMPNRRVLPIARALLTFVRERITAHRVAGDLTPWARGLSQRAADSIGGPIGSTLIRLLDALQEDPNAKAELSALVRYLTTDASSYDAFDSTLVQLVDLLFALEDDTNIVPLLHVLSESVAPGARAATTNPTGALVLNGGAVDESLQVLREIQRVDDRLTMRDVLQNLVTMDPTGQETPLEVLVDVVAEVNRASPGAGGTFDQGDYEEALFQLFLLMTSESRGLERLYDVIQGRETPR